MLIRAVFAAALLSSCASVPPGNGEPVLHYLRTNIDGSEPERVVVHVVSPTQIEVFKARSRCTNAAYVTADLDASGQARSLVGGRVTRELAQEAFAWLGIEDGQLAARLGDHADAPAFVVRVAPRWVVYDFDFADLIAAPPDELRRAAPLAFDLPLISDRGAGFALENLGTLELAPDGRERHLGRPALRYRARGPALGLAEGTLWFREGDGRLLEARLPIPNHAEYRDFRLRLVDEQHGAQAWRAVLADHWAGCPAGE